MNWVGILLMSFSILQGAFHPCSPMTLKTAARDGDLETVIEALDGKEPDYELLRWSNDFVLSYLLQRGACANPYPPFNSRCRENEPTLLQCAVEQGNVPRVALLLAHGAQDENGKSLKYAAMGMHLALTKILSFNNSSQHIAQALSAVRDKMSWENMALDEKCLNDLKSIQAVLQEADTAKELEGQLSQKKEVLQDDEWCTIF